MISQANSQKEKKKINIVSQPTRKVYDNIHGFIRFEKRIWLFVDTHQFQKLRFIKQLGCLSYVFPGATHTRFQHCLGTGHLAKTFMELLIKHNDYLYKNVDTKSAIFTVTLAGIMHDIGHGPFSHTFDGQIVKTNILQKNNQKQQKTWKHQIGSQILFRHIVEKQKLIEKQIITEKQVQRVVNLIHGETDGFRQWQFQLISNKITGIDVDKLDYFRRDAFYLGAKGVLIDHQLLMNQARIIYDDKSQNPKWTICFPSKYALQVNDIFYSRYKLYKTYYLNNISKGIQFMIMDILKLVQPIYEFTKICQNIKLGDQWVEKYVSLTDSILERIQWLDQFHPKYKEYEQKIKKAKQILKRLKGRDIYRFVREVQTSITLQILKDNKKILQDAFNAENISKFIQEQTKIPRDQYHIAVTQAGYGLKNINPLNKVKFFRKQDFKDQQQQKYECLSDQDFRAQNISILYTKAFAQRFAKLFVKDVESVDLIKKVNKAFCQYFDLRKKKCGIVFNHLNMGRTSFYPSQEQLIERVKQQEIYAVKTQKTTQSLP